MLLLGCAFAAITGAYNYAKTRIRLRHEKIKNEQFTALGFDTNGTSGDLRFKAFTSAALAIAGGLGIFIFIYRSNRSNKFTQQRNYKTTQL